MPRTKKYNIYLTKEESSHILNTFKEKGLNLSYISVKVFEGRRKKEGKYLKELLKRILNAEIGMNQQEYDKLMQYVNCKVLLQDEYEKLLYAKDKLDRIEMMLFAPKC